MCPPLLSNRSFPSFSSLEIIHRTQTTVNKMTRSMRKKFKLGHNVRKVMRQNGLESGKVQHVKQLCCNFASIEDPDIISELNRRSGRPTILTKVAECNGTPFHHGIPTKSWVRSFRSRHSELSYRAICAKDITKADAEHPDHIIYYTML